MDTGDCQDLGTGGGGIKSSCLWAVEFPLGMIKMSGTEMGAAQRGECTKCLSLMVISISGTPISQREERLTITVTIPTKLLILVDQMRNISYTPRVYPHTSSRKEAASDPSYNGQTELLQAWRAHPGTTSLLLLLTTEGRSHVLQDLLCVRWHSPFCEPQVVRSYCYHPFCR